MAKPSSKSRRSALKGKAKAKSPRTARGTAVNAHVPAAPTVEEGMARVSAKPGFFASLTSSERTALASYKGPEVSGGPGPVVTRRLKRAAS